MASAQPKSEPTIYEKRVMMHNAIVASIEKLPPLPQDFEELDLQIPTRDGWLSRTRIVRPKDTTASRCPLIVHFFGGGMIVGEPEQLLSAARAFAQSFGAVVALPSYRLVPDVLWPVPEQDGWDVVAWLSEHAEAELGADLSAGFVVGGVSAGGSVAAVSCGLAMFEDAEEARPKLAKPITGQFLSAAGVAVDEIVPEEYKSLYTARDECRNMVGFNTAMMDGVYEGMQVTDYTSLWFSPLSTLAKQEPARKIPTYLEHCGLDPLRDDTTVYAKLLEAKGVPTKVRLFKEDTHSSWTVLPPGMKAKDPTVQEAQLEGMKWLLEFSQ